MKKKLDSDLKINLNGKRHCGTDSLKYLEILIDKNMTWKQQINHLAIKLNMLPKLRYVLDSKTLRLV